MTKRATARTGSALALRDVRFAYRGGPQMAFDLIVESGALVALMGPSGSGKSTLLNLVAGFEIPVSGRIEIAGRDMAGLSPAQRPVSMVFQENNLFGHLDVAANIGLGRSPALRLSESDRAAIADAVARTGLAGKEKRLPGALSGGERQRVALARVLVRDRPVLLLDEAFASLGPALRDEMLDLLAALQRERGMTVVMATHDPDDARRIAGTIVFVEEGRIAGAGPTATFLDGGGPEGFARYIGKRGGEARPHIARKRT